MNQLTKQIQIAVAATAGKLTDYGQRSAIGMARSYLDSQKFKESNSLDRKPARDGLASDLVSIMEGHDETDCIAALLEARQWVNQPFLDPAMLGFQAARLARGSVGSAKKNEKNK